MNKQLVKKLNAMARRSKHGVSKAKMFTKSTYELRVLKERS